MTVGEAGALSMETNDSLFRQARRGGAWTVAGEVCQRLAQTVTFIALAAILEPRQFGAAATAFFIVQIIYGLTYAGIGAAVQSLGPDVRRDRSARGFALLTGSAAAFFLLVLAEPVSRVMHTPDATNLILLIAIVPPTLQYTTVAVALLERDFHFRMTALAQVVSSVFSVAVGLLLAISGAGAIALVAAAVTQQIVRLLVLAVGEPTVLTFAFHRDCIAEIWAIGRHLMGTSLSFAVYNNVDTFAVGALLGAHALGLYSFAYNAAMTTFFLASVAVSRTLLPIFARMRREGQPIGRLYADSLVAVSWLISLPLGLLIVLGPNLLHTFFGGAWDDASLTLRLLCLAAYLRVAGPACVPTLIVFERPQLLWRVQVGQLLGMSVLLYPLARVAGVGGCAVAVAVPILVGAVYLLRVSMSLAGVHSAEVLPLTLAGPAVGLGCGLFGLLLPTYTSMGALLQLVVAVALWVAITSLVSPTMRGMVARFVPLVAAPSASSAPKPDAMGSDSVPLPAPAETESDPLWRRVARVVYGSQFAHRLVPWVVARYVADLQTAFRWHNPAIRRLARRHAEFLLGKSSRAADVPAVAHAYLRQYSRLAERRWRPWLTTRQRVERLEVLQHAAASGRGVILSFLHHGDFYSVFPSLKRAGLSPTVHIAAAPFHFAAHPKFFHRQGLRTAQRQGGVEVFNAAGSFDYVCELLRSGQTVGLACDMPGALPVTFLGRDVLAAAGTAVAALRTGALVVPVTAHPEGDGQYLTVMDPIDPNDFGDAASLLQEVLNRHEAAVLAWPEVLQLPLIRWGVPEAEQPTPGSVLEAAR